VTARDGAVTPSGRLDVESVVDLAATLISIPSQGGIDPPGPIIDALGDWLASRGMPATVLRDAAGDAVGLYLDIGPGGAPHHCLNACLDTAPFGDPEAWSFPPTAAEVRSGWLGGRGAADCKTAIAMFAHIGLEIAATVDAGTLTLLFDADEHTGRFGGVHAYVATGARPDGVMIGYPGLDEVLVGARGFWRADVDVFGRGAHSGSIRAPVDNAVAKSATLVRLLDEADLPGPVDGEFPLPPRVTVTGIHGGQGYSVVPDRCRVSLDVRLTPRHDAAWAERLVRRLCQAVDETVPSRRPTAVELRTTWPAYWLPETSPLARALGAGARAALGRSVPLAVAGPSNIGNYLAALGIEATCGFGVAYRNLHGADEAIDVASIPPVYEAYVSAVRSLLAGPDPVGGRGG
jgi:succinyl-diaminopimelate desuccinylase